MSFSSFSLTNSSVSDQLRLAFFFCFWPVAVTPVTFLRFLLSPSFSIAWRRISSAFAVSCNFLFLADSSRSNSTYAACSFSAISSKATSSSESSGTSTPDAWIAFTFDAISSHACPLSRLLFLNLYGSTVNISLARSISGSFDQGEKKYLLYTQKVKLPANQNNYPPSQKNQSNERTSNMCFFSTSYNPSPSKKKIKNFVLNTVRCNYKKIILHFQDFAQGIPE